jgi:hypothetical protein
MSEITKHTRHRPLLIFFVLCFVLSWGLWMPLVIFRNGLPEALGFTLVLVGSLVPSSAAITIPH